MLSRSCEEDVTRVARLFRSQVEPAKGLRAARAMVLPGRWSSVGNFRRHGTANVRCGFPRIIACAILCVGVLANRVCLADQRLTLIDNSTGLSQATDVNIYGHVIGLKDVKTRIGFEQQPFYWNGDTERVLPLGPKEKGFTNVYPESLSDAGCVVGYASRGIGDPRGAMEACLWDMNDGSFTGLGRLKKDHRGSHAFDVSDDGNVIVGYSAGSDPPTMVPVVWTKSEAGWAAERLPTIHDMNPKLMVSRVVVSGDGNRVAACLTERILDEPVLNPYVTATFAWRRDPQGVWQRAKVSGFHMHLADINDDGVLVGSVVFREHRRGFAISSRGELRILDPLAGDSESAATDVNNDGDVVGYSDSPRSDTGVPNAVVWRDNQPRPLDIPGQPVLSWATAINDAGDVAGYLTKGSRESGEADDEPVSVSESSRTFPFVLRSIENNAQAENP